MSSANSRPPALRIWTSLVIACAGAVALSGCGVNVHSASVRGTGYVRMDEAIKHHPLYAQLSQLTDAIAAIDLQAAMPQVPLSGAQIAQQTAVLNRELRDAQVRANKILAQKQQDYTRREQQAVAAALAAAGVKGAGTLAAQQMSSQSAQQMQQAASAANSDFMAYQQSVIAQDNAASSSVAKQLEAQATQQYRAKAMQLQQNETDLSLRLTQQDAQQRLAIKMRLSNLAMDETSRKQAQAQLAALDAKEASALNAQRKTDAATLQAYQAQLRNQTGNAIRSQVGAIQAQTQAKIAEHRNQVGAQLRNLGPPALPTNLPPGLQARIQQIHSQFVAQFQADALKTVNDYNATKADLSRQFAALHGADVGATGAAGKELNDLQHRRDALYAQMVGQVQRDAARLAKEQGFSIVFVNVEAATGGYDMTGQVIKDLESQHE